MLVIREPTFATTLCVLAEYKSFLCHFRDEKEDLWNDIKVQRGNWARVLHIRPLKTYTAKTISPGLQVGKMAALDKETFIYSDLFCQCLETLTLTDWKLATLYNKEVLRLKVKVKDNAIQKPSVFSKEMMKRVVQIFRHEKMHFCHVNIMHRAWIVKESYYAVFLPWQLTFFLPVKLKVSCYTSYSLKEYCMISRCVFPKIIMMTSDSVLLALLNLVRHIATCYTSCGTTTSCLIDTSNMSVATCKSIQKYRWKTLDFKN